MLFIKPTRLLINKSNKHLYIQLISLENGNVILSSSTLQENLFKGTDIKHSDLKIAHQLATLFSIKLKSLGLTSIIYNQNKYKYHGKVKMILDTLRDNNIKFSKIKDFNY